MIVRSYPNKVFDYMAAGKPIILAIDGVIRELVENAKAGKFVNPGDSLGIADSILSYESDPNLCLDHGKNGYQLVRSSFDRQQHVVLVKKTFEEAIEGF